MKKTINLIISTSYSLVMAYILLVNIIYRRDKIMWVYYDLIIPNWAIIVIAAICSIVFLYILKITPKHIERKKMICFYLISSIALFIVQIVVVKEIFLYIDWDVKFLRYAAYQFLDGELTRFSTVYFLNNPNNIMMYGITVAFLKIGEILSLDGYVILVGVGILLNNLAVLFSSLCVYRITKKSNIAIFSYILAALIYGLSPWMLAPYTDIFSVLLPVLTLYIYIRMKQWKQGNIIVKAIVVTLIPALFYLLKPTNIFILLGIAIVEIYALIKDLVYEKDKEKKIAGFKEKAVEIVAGTLCFVLLVFFMKTTLYTALNYQEDETVKKPVEHYFMLGSNNYMTGMYNTVDDDFTTSFKTIEEKKKADLDRAFERYREMGIIGTIKHISDKTYMNYGIGILGWGKEQHFVNIIPPKESALEKFLTDIYYVGGDRLFIKENSFGVGGKYFKYYSSWMQFLWMFILVMCFETGLGYEIRLIKDKRRKDNKRDLCDDVFFVLSIVLVGVFIFLSVFETNARYLYSFLPLFVVMGMYRKQED